MIVALLADVAPALAWDAVQPVTVGTGTRAVAWDAIEPPEWFSAAYAATASAQALGLTQQDFETLYQSMGTYLDAASTSTGIFGTSSVGFRVTVPAEAWALGSGALYILGDQDWTRPGNSDGQPGPSPFAVKRAASFNPVMVDVGAAVVDGARYTAGGAAATQFFAQQGPPTNARGSATPAMIDPGAPIVSDILADQSAVVLLTWEPDPVRGAGYRRVMVSQSDTVDFHGTASAGGGFSLVWEGTRAAAGAPPLVTVNITTDGRQVHWEFEQGGGDYLYSTEGGDMATRSLGNAYALATTDAEEVAAARALVTGEVELPPAPEESEEPTSAFLFDPERPSVVDTSTAEVPAWVPGWLYDWAKAAVLDPVLSWANGFTDLLWPLEEVGRWTRSHW